MRSLSFLSVFITIAKLHLLSFADGFTARQLAIKVSRAKPQLFLSGQNGMDNNQEKPYISEKDDSFPNTLPRSYVRRALFLSSVVSIAAGGSLIMSVGAYTTMPSGFKRIPTQFIAALGDPQSSKGSNANEWGLWKLDPGPRGVWLKQYNSVLVRNKGIAPAGWKFDPNDWWLEEHGLIMEAPLFPLPQGKYLVTGGRSTTAVLTVDKPAGNTKQQSWSLDSNAKLYDVTHLPCRSARYSPVTSGNVGSPLNARIEDFPVSPGAEMPSVEGTKKQDYAVLFVIGVEDNVKEL